LVGRLKMNANSCCQQTTVIMIWSKSRINERPLRVFEEQRHVEDLQLVKKCLRKQFNYQKTKKDTEK